MGFHRQTTSYTSLLSLAIFYIASLFHLAYKAVCQMETAQHFYTNKFLVIFVARDQSKVRLCKVTCGEQCKNLSSKSHCVWLSYSFPYCELVRKRRLQPKITCQGLDERIFRIDPASSCRRRRYLRRVSKKRRIYTKIIYRGGRKYRGDPYPQGIQGMRHHLQKCE